MNYQITAEQLAKSWVPYRIEIAIVFVENYAPKNAQQEDIDTLFNDVFFFFTLAEQNIIKAYTNDKFTLTLESIMENITNQLFKIDKRLKKIISSGDFLSNYQKNFREQSNYYHKVVKAFLPEDLRYKLFQDGIAFEMNKLTSFESEITSLLVGHLQTVKQTTAVIQFGL